MPGMHDSWQEDAVRRIASTRHYVQEVIRRTSNMNFKKELGAVDAMLNDATVLLQLDPSYTGTMLHGHLLDKVRPSIESLRRSAKSRVQEDLLTTALDKLSVATSLAATRRDAEGTWDQPTTDEPTDDPLASLWSATFSWRSNHDRAANDVVEAAAASLFEWAKLDYAYQNGPRGISQDRAIEETTETVDRLIAMISDRMAELIDTWFDENRKPGI